MGGPRLCALGRPVRVSGVEGLMGEEAMIVVFCFDKTKWEVGKRKEL